MKKLILSSLFMTILSTAALATPSSLEGVTSRVATNTDKLTDFALGKLQGLFDATTKAIPTVTKYTLQVTQMGCLIQVVYWVLSLLVTCLGLFFFFKYAKKVQKEFTDFDMTMCLISAGVTFLATINTLIDLNLWNWVCVVHPDIYLIHLAVQKVLG